MSDYPLPHGVPTFVTIPELRLLQKYAHEAGTVLEIGTWYGYTAIGMALAGAHVTSVDPHNACDQGGEDTWEPFLANAQRHGFRAASVAGDEDACLIADRAVILGYRWPIQMLAPSRVSRLGPIRFGLVFIDGDHGAPAPMRDAEIAFAHLREPYYIAFHDVNPSYFLDVWLAVRELERTGRMVKLEQERYLAVYRAVL